MFFIIGVNLLVSFCRTDPVQFTPVDFKLSTTAGTPSDAPHSEEISVVDVTVESVKLKYGLRLLFDAAVDDGFECVQRIETRMLRMMEEINLEAN